MNVADLNFPGFFTGDLPGTNYFVLLRMAGFRWAARWLEFIRKT